MSVEDILHKMHKNSDDSLIKNVSLEACYTMLGVQKKYRSVYAMQMVNDWMKDQLPSERFTFTPNDILNKVMEAIEKDKQGGSEHYKIWFKHNYPDMFKAEYE